MSYQDDLPQIRAKAQEILQRASNDPAFRKQIEADPNGVLAEYGIPERAAPVLINETGEFAAPQADCDDSCNDFTCIVTICPATCLATVPGCLPPPTNQAEQV